MLKIASVFWCHFFWGYPGLLGNSVLVSAFRGIFICTLLKHITQKSYLLGFLEISKLSIMDCLLHGNETKQKQTLMLLTYNYISSKIIFFNFILNIFT